MSAEAFVVPLDTIERQRRAANPAASAWVSANAGAGKTRVLTDRVIRLLLAGAAPSRILCLTFTKAAAAEMTNRIFASLGTWVTMPAGKLTETLEGLTGERPSKAVLAKARRLFARAVETPGGLKIETIHAFCERILHLVPFEANVPARFAVLDESQTAELLAEARAKILTEASIGGPRSAELARALETVALYCAGPGLTALIDHAVLDPNVPGDPDGRDLASSRLRAALGLAPGQNSADLKRAMLEDGIPASEWPSIAAELRSTGKSSDADQASSLDAAFAQRRQGGRLAAYRSVFFTDKGEPRRSLGTKGVAPGILERLVDEQGRLAGLAETLAAAEAAERTEALFVLAGAVRREAEGQKVRLGALDFADLIRKTLALLDRGSAAWVLYKLDRGIDHVLLDEAQDTNPDQWRILRRITEEFTAGAGRPVQAPRTVFAVGDPKQSIYSFQGADPRWFEDGRRHWLTRTRSAELRFEDVRLDLSFRSAPAILKAVDYTFGMSAHYRGLVFDESMAGTSHASARPNAPGHVEIWPTEVRAEDGKEPDAWELPLDEPERHAPSVVVASRIAKAVRCWTTEGDGAGRVWQPRDILILVRSRGPAFFAVIRALKSVAVPVAGADRFDIGEHIGVNDLVAAGRAAILPRDDLALAAALKSPLVGLDDDDLVRIASGRDDDEPLVAALARSAGEGDPAAITGRDALESWRTLARAHGPFGFYAALLGPGGARRRLIERLGGEAADAVDAFLSYAQSSEVGAETPSLSTFLARFESAEHTIKRDLDSTGNEVRVMTVHGAKGLEAPVVVVLDGCEVTGKEPVLVPLVAGNGDPLPVWSPGRQWDCRAITEARERAKDLRREEHNRLLYVAMTRAKDLLVVAPFVGRGKEPEEAWCAMIRRGFAATTEALVRTETPYGPVDLWRDGARDAGPGTAGGDALEAEPEALPPWLLEPAAAETDAGAPLRPSQAVAETGPVDFVRRTVRLARAEARRRGTLVHALIDHLAPVADEARVEAASRFLAVRSGSLDDALRARLVADVLAVLRRPELAELFGPNSRGEAPIAGRLPMPGGRERRVTGQIDRLAVSGTEVLFADFKTGNAAPDGAIPDAYLAQLALYRAVLQEAYPGRSVRALLVWTAVPDVAEPSPEELDSALRKALSGPS